MNANVKGALFALLILSLAPACGAANDAAFRLTAGPSTGQTADGTAGEQYRIGALPSATTEDPSGDDPLDDEGFESTKLTPPALPPLAPESYFPDVTPSAETGRLVQAKPSSPDLEDDDRGIGKTRPVGSSNPRESQREQDSRDRSHSSDQTAPTTGGRRHSSPDVVGVIPPRQAEQPQNSAKNKTPDDAAREDSTREDSVHEEEEPQQDIDSGPPVRESAQTPEGPLCSSECDLTLSRDTLWPPNGAMIAVELSGPDASACTILDVNDNETNLVTDFRIKDKQSVELRAKRSGTSKNGRTYTIELECETTSGMSYPKMSVRVSHDQGKGK